MISAAAPLPCSACCAQPLTSGRGGVSRGEDVIIAAREGRLTDGMPINVQNECGPTTRPLQMPGLRRGPCAESAAQKPSRLQGGQTVAINAHDAFHLYCFNLCQSLLMVLARSSLAECKSAQFAQLTGSLVNESVIR